MKLTRTRGHVINMGNYESLRTEATVELDLEGMTKIPQSAYDKADELLAAALASDLKEAGKLTDVTDSYILSWKGAK